MIHSQPEGFLAVPRVGKGPGVLVLHAWWGLNDTIKAFCTRLADSGFVAFAPDLYHGKIADTIPDAEKLSTAFDADQAQVRADIADAKKFLIEHAGQTSSDLAVIGFSLGAYYALDLAATDPGNISSVVVFYGTGPVDFSRSKAAFLGHFAEKDEYEPQSNVDNLRSSLAESWPAGDPLSVSWYRTLVL